MTTVTTAASATNTDPAFTLAIALADDALILGHRLSEWSGRAPTLEEDIALSNLGLDLIGQARAFYTLASAIEGKGRDEDDFAYFRDVADFRNCLLVEQPNGDFAVTMLRQFLFASFMRPYFAALARSKDRRFADIAAKAVNEMAYHVRHSAEWVIRLGDGTSESRRRLIAAADDLWGFTGELFEPVSGEVDLVRAGNAPDRAALRTPWSADVAHVFAQARVPMPAPRFMQSGGRNGCHGEHLGHLLAEMQVLARAHPDAVW